MIINDTINLHNVGQTKSYKGGLMLLRYPSNVISKMGYGPNIKGKTKALYPAMVEIQVSTLSSYVDISLMAIESDAQVICYINNFSVGIANIRKGKIERIRFELHKRQMEYLHRLGDKPVLWRFIMPSYTRISFYEIVAQNKLNKICDNESYILYGSSISQGVGALNGASSYAFCLQENLHISILNKALSGSCLLEPDVVNYLASLNAKGYILELGCNARGVMDDIEFAKRLDYMLDLLITLKPNCPIVIVNILEMLENIYKKNNIVSEFAQKDVLFIKQIKRLVKKYNEIGHIYLISGSKLATTLDCLSQDLLHPSNKGHEMIALGISKVMKKYNLC